MENYDAFIALGVAFAAGLLIGFEREQSAPDEPTERRRSFVGGARTYPLVSLSGALAGLLGARLGWALPLAGLIALVAFLVLAYLDVIKRDAERGITSEMAFVCAYLLGATATLDGVIEPIGRRAILVLACAVAITVILSAKPPLHKIADRASKEDVFATLKFLLVAVVVLPLLPNRTYGPLDVINPFKVGLLVVMIAGIDFVGYVAVRVLGPGRGLGVTGLVGGLASSTAVTLSVANRAKQERGLVDSLALAAVMASSIMVPRILVVVAVLHWPLTQLLAIPLGAMGIGGAAAAFWLYRRSRQSDGGQAEALAMHNPFELGSALKWGLIFTAVLFFAKLAHQELGSRGSYLAALIAGATDVDAITLTMASLAKEGSLAPRVAVTAILLGAGSNTLVKAAMAAIVGGGAFGKRVALSLGLMVVCGAVALGLTYAIA